MRSSLYLLKEGVAGLWKNRMMSISSIAILMSCLLLTGIAVLVSLNLDDTMSKLEEENTITVFLYTETPKLESVKTGEQIRQIDNIIKCEYVSGSQALEDMLETMGDDANLLAGFDDFMPDAYKIKIGDITRYQETVDTIEQLKYVESYSDYSKVATTLSDLDRLIRYASIAIIIVLALVALFIIANTLKVAMFTRRVEIKVMKSVGATNLFIRIPFIVEGILIGFISGVASATILYYSYIELAPSISSLVTFIEMIKIEKYQILIYIMYSIAGALFGLVGGMISIGRYLKKEGERAIS